MKKALIVVDMQNDFCDHGALAVSGANEIIPVINNLMESSEFDLIISTQDFHPANHKSFASVSNKELFSMSKLNGLDQRMWPDHCVQGTLGAEFHPELNVALIDKNFTKGENPEVDSYSGFYDNDKKSSTGMNEWMKEQGIEEVVVVGLARDFCVKATALDAAKVGFKTTVLLDASRSVNMTPTADEEAIKEMRDNNVVVK